ncbi:hypothetical protein [Phyllobacterium ifriqiyense]|uniref:hypothetical protein n=1 Tax=Phyllobacterium ifriqiyense TaxID=314238 RepID=UPI0033976C89
MSRNQEEKSDSFPSEAELFNALTKSAFDFLERSIDEFADSPKFSTIHFASAIELFLKARLMLEHWLLILDKPDQADKVSFFKGNAKTTTPDQTIERLRRIANVSIQQTWKDIFTKIAQHRNKMVHFVHAGASQVGRADEQKQLAEEQCGGWLALRTLLSEWPEFAGFKNDISRVGIKMEGHRTYLQKAFEAKEPELRFHRDGGGRCIDCPSCGFLSVKVETPVGAIAEARCLVCRYFRGAEITLTCVNEDCKQPIHFTSYEGPTDSCLACGEGIASDEVREQLDTGEGVHSGNYMDHTPINCPQCVGYHTVVKHHELYICTQCFDVGTKYGICGYCSEGQLGGVSDHSYATGCEFCDGAVGNIRDD